MKEEEENKLIIYRNILNFKKVFIYTNKYGYYISKILQFLCYKNNVYSEIVYDIDLNNFNLYIITFCQKVKVFPKNYIIYQLEQKDISKWIDKKYELAILFSLKTVDYSKSNINKFPEIIKKKMDYYPIPIIPYQYLNNKYICEVKPKNNILFYGSLNNIRKNKLNYLQRKLGSKYFIKIINNIFGEELFYEILNSKIVLNIHFYKESILETYRINEVLSCKRCVISENPNMIDIDNYNLYKDKVIFVNNLDEMIYNINNILNKSIETPQISMYDINDFNNKILNFNN